MSAVLTLVGAFVVADAAEVTPPAQIAVSPSRFEVEIGTKPTTEAVDVMNLGDEPVAIAVSVVTWDLDEANKVRILDPDEQSLDQWMVVNPLQFTVPPGKSQTVRFSIRPKVRPEPGEHRAMLYFEQVLPAESTGKMRVKFKLGVAVYGLAGEVTRVGKLHDVEVDSYDGPVRVRFDVSSEGTANVRLAGEYAIYRAAEFQESVAWWGTEPGVATDGPPAHPVATGTLPTRPVLPGSRREVVLRAGALDPGEYILDIKGALAGETINLAVPFAVFAPGIQARKTEE
jgi:hypothetical protein